MPRSQARNYVAAQQREIDRVVNERSAALDRMTETLVENAERFRRQAEQMLNSLDVVIDEARQALESDRSVISRPSTFPSSSLHRRRSPSPISALSQASRRCRSAASPRRPEPEPEPEPEPVAEIAIEEEVADIEAEAEAEVEADEAVEEGEPTVRLAAYQGTAVDEDEAAEQRRQRRGDASRDADGDRGQHPRGDLPCPRGRLPGRGLKSES